MIMTFEKTEAPVFRLTYVSIAATPIDHEELLQIAQTAKKNNSALDVSGLLIECAGEFLQILEGEKDVVLSLYEVIKRDPRHAKASVLQTEECVPRRFESWEMGCFCFDPDDLPEGFLFELVRDRQQLRVDSEERAQDMLTTFYRENRRAGEGVSFASMIDA